MAEAQFISDKAQGYDVLNIANQAASLVERAQNTRMRREQMDYQKQQQDYNQYWGAKMNEASMAKSEADLKNANAEYESFVESKKVDGRIADAQQEFSNDFQAANAQAEHKDAVKMFNNFSGKYAWMMTSKKGQAMLQALDAARTARLNEGVKEDQIKMWTDKENALNNRNTQDNTTREQIADNSAKVKAEEKRLEAIEKNADDLIKFHQNKIELRNNAVNGSKGEWTPETYAEQNKLNDEDMAKIEQLIKEKGRIRLGDSAEGETQNGKQIGDVKFKF